MATINVQFSIVVYDKETHGDFSAANLNKDYRIIARIEDHTTWRELGLVLRTATRVVNSFDMESTSVEVMVLDDTGRTAFPLTAIMPGEGCVQTTHPQIVAENHHEGLVTTMVRLSNDDITALMKLLPLGNSSHSGLREKLHRASISLNKKK